MPLALFRVKRTRFAVAVEESGAHLAAEVAHRMKIQVEM